MLLVLFAWIQFFSCPYSLLHFKWKRFKKHSKPEWISVFNILIPPGDKLYFSFLLFIFFPTAILFHFFFLFPCCFSPGSSQPFPLPLGAYSLLCPDASLFPRGAVSRRSAGGSHGLSQGSLRWACIALPQLPIPACPCQAGRHLLVAFAQKRAGGTNCFLPCCVMEHSFASDAAT